MLYGKARPPAFDNGIAAELCQAPRSILRKNAFAKYSAFGTGVSDAGMRRSEPQCSAPLASGVNVIGSVSILPSACR